MEANVQYTHIYSTESWKRQKMTYQPPPLDDDLMDFTEEFIDVYAYLFTNMSINPDDDLEDNLENFPELSF